ncbi:MAG TPA: baseplate J/gp47 family protein [Candidatus Limnocylindria bacterium]|nr:baseplate J/gp47 family protein [Candidatus Limnocylindria bacterium]
MPANIYLEPEDEITAAVSRLRTLGEPEAVLVLSRSSRIGTSRINFKLLAREAHQQGINLVAVSDEPTVRALAVSAGLPAYDTVRAAEQALENFRRQDEALAPAGARLPGAPRPRPRSEGDSGTTVTSSGGTPLVGPALAAAGAAAAGAASAGAASSAPSGRLRPVGEAEATRRLPLPGGRAGETTLPDARPDASPDAAGGRAAGARGRSRRRAAVLPLLALGLLGGLLAGGLYLAYVYLPTATIELRPHTQPLGPLEVRVTADPEVAVPDASAGLIPAQQLEMVLRVEEDFSATGLEIVREAASGTVRFSSENTVFDVPIPAGTVVSTADGIEFATVTSVIVPKASFATGRTHVDAPVLATAPGPRGNVPAEAITELPPDLAAAVVFVSNLQPTSGGTRLEQLVVTQEDYDAALETLTGALSEELTARLADPATTPRGLTTFPTSVSTDLPLAEPSAAELVGGVGPEFSLALGVTARVLAVDEALVEQLAADQLRSSLGTGRSLVDEGIATSHTPGQVIGETVVYRASASAQVYSQPDRAALLEGVRGKPVSEARAILEQHGSVAISLWPEVVDRLPEQVARINLTILPPREGP